MPPPALTRKEALWLACKQKTCCHGTMVVPSGRDIWRIARALDTPPWAFLVYFANPRPRRDAFRLEPGAPGFRLALAKGHPVAEESPPPCIFLLTTRNGYHRCGLGEGRPEVCKTFPAEVVNGMVLMRPDSGCTCRDWSLTDVDIVEEQAGIAARQADLVEYLTVVERWNAQVDAAPEGTAFTFFDYCTFLLDTYDTLAVPAGSTL